MQDALTNLTGLRTKDQYTPPARGSGEETDVAKNSGADVALSHEAGRESAPDKFVAIFDGHTITTETVDSNLSIRLTNDTIAQHPSITSELDDINFDPITVAQRSRSLSPRHGEGETSALEAVFIKSFVALPLVQDEGDLGQQATLDMPVLEMPAPDNAEIDNSTALLATTIEDTAAKTALLGKKSDIDPESNMEVGNSSLSENTLINEAAIATLPSPNAPHIVDEIEITPTADMSALGKTALNDDAAPATSSAIYTIQSYGDSSKEAELRLAPQTQPYGSIETTAQIVQPAVSYAEMGFSTVDQTQLVDDVQTNKNDAVAENVTQVEETSDVILPDKLPLNTEKAVVMGNRAELSDTIIDSRKLDSVVNAIPGVKQNGDGAETLPAEIMDAEQHSIDTEFVEIVSDEKLLTTRAGNADYRLAGQSETFSAMAVSPTVTSEAPSVFGLSQTSIGQVSTLNPNSISPTNPSSPAILQPAILRVVDEALIAAKTSPESVSVRLDPPEMGRVYIDFIFDKDGNISANIRSENIDVQSQLRDRSDHFLNLLKESGLSDVSLSFELYKEQNSGAEGYENQAHLSNSQDEAETESERSSQIINSPQKPQYNYVYDANSAGINLVL